MVSAQKLSMQGDKYLGRLYTEMDCQAFVERCMKDAGISKNLPGSNAWYREMTWVGTPEECVKKFGSIPAGAFLFILEKNGKEPAQYKPDGIGNASHIGMKTGRTGAQMVANAKASGNTIAGQYNFGDGAIHSSGSRAHVATSTFKDRAINGGWNRVGLWNKIDYGAKINRILSGDPGGGDDDDQGGGSVMQATVKTETGTGVNFRAKKSTGSGLLGKIPEGATVDVSSDDGTWSAVTYQGKSGYVMSQFLSYGSGGGDDKTPVQVTLDRSSAESLLTALNKALKR